MKKIVKFAKLGAPPKVGLSATVYTHNYPGNHRIEAGYAGIVYTSAVVKVFDDGSFETLNSMYKPEF